MICTEKRAIKKPLTFPRVAKWIVMLAKEFGPCNFVNSAALGWETHWTAMKYSFPSSVLFTLKLY